MKIATATLTDRYPLTKVGSTKSTYHVRLSFTDPTVSFKPGDSIALYAHNDPVLVDHLLESLQVTGDEEVVDTRSKEQMTLRNFFLFKANLARLTSSLLTLVFESETDHERKNKLSHHLDKERLKLFLSLHDPLDLFKEHCGLKIPPQELCARFSPLLPRFYSIASSPLVDPHSIDLTVALFTYTHSGERRYGVASHFLCHLAEPLTTPIPFYIQPAHRFALPQDLNAPMIMVGPGTGVAPFRAFLQERQLLSSKARHWLFFGERHSAYDFFYEDFWEELVTQGLLTLTTAFSRDQEQKIYVQDRLLEHGAEIYQWIEEGSYFYVCGDADQMAKDVDRALHQIVQLHGNLTEEAAKERIKSLKKEGRYLQDVY